MNATEAKRKLCELRSSLRDKEADKAIKSLDKVDNYEPFVNLLEAYVVGNKFDKEK